MEPKISFGTEKSSMNPKINKGIENSKIIASDYWCDVNEDSWEEGELGHANSWDGKLSRTEFSSVKELLEAVHNELYLPVDDFAELPFIDGTLQLTWEVNVDNEEPSEDEIARWKAGEINLYILDMFIPLKFGTVHEMTNEEAFDLGLDALIL